MRILINLSKKLAVSFGPMLVCPGWMHPSRQSRWLAQLSHSIVAHAWVVLWSVEGVSNTEIAIRLGWINATAGKWRWRFAERGLPGLCDELRPGRPRGIEDDEIATLLQLPAASLASCDPTLTPDAETG